MPLTIYHQFDVKQVNFPHLAERLSLIVIVTFGEMLVNVTRYFSGSLISLFPLVIFILVASLFGFYVFEYEYLMDHHQQSRGFIAMYSHVFVVVALLTMTAGLDYIADNEVSRTVIWLILLISITVYYFCVLSNGAYNKAEKRLTVKDHLTLFLILIVGVIISFMLRDNNLGLVFGFTLSSVSNLFYLFIQKIH